MPGDSGGTFCCALLSVKLFGGQTFKADDSNRGSHYYIFSEMTILKVLHLTISPSIRTGVFPRLKNGSDRMEGVSFKNGACFLCGRPRIKPGGGAGFAINGLSPTNSFDEKGSGTPRDDILTKLLCSCQRRMFHVHRRRNFDRWHLN